MFNEAYLTYSLMTCSYQMNTEKTDGNILRYLKFIVISSDARTQKSRDGVFQKQSLQFYSQKHQSVYKNS